MYTWIAETFGIADGLARGLAFAIALGIVLILIALFVYILKRLTGSHLSAGRNRQPRIAVMDAANIDTRRRLLLIRRDNVEHLILVGGPSDIVVEQGIVKNSPLAANGPRPQTVMPAAPGYTVPTADPDNAQIDTAQTAAPAEAAARLAAQTPPAAKPPQSPVVRPSAPVPPEPSVRRPVQPEPAKRTATPPAFSQNRQDQPKPNPARSLLQAAASGRIAPTFGKDQPASGVKPHVQNPGQPPLQATRPAQAQRPVNPAQVNTPAKSAAPHPDAAVAGYTHDLAHVSAPRQDPAAPQTPRQVTPPSSGPAARATTAFLKPAAQNDAAGPSAPLPSQPAAPEAGENEKPPIPEPADKVSSLSSQPEPTVQLSPQVAPEVHSNSTAPDIKTADIEAIFADDPAQETGASLPDTPGTPGDDDTTPADTGKKEVASDAPNPLEDEMAKILDEMHGSQKQ
jgi:flagellar protein FliO/FliZ